MGTYITWRELHALSLARARELSKAGQIWVTADSSTVGELRILPLQKDNQSNVASGEKLVILPAASVSIDNQVSRKTADLARIPGVFRGMPPTREPAPEPEIIYNVVPYQRGRRYPAGQKVSIWNPRTKQMEIREAPETDAEGNEI